MSEEYKPNEGDPVEFWHKAYGWIGGEVVGVDGSVLLVEHNDGYNGCHLHEVRPLIPQADIVWEQDTAPKVSTAENKQSPYPIKDEVYKHHSGRLYVVQGFANEETQYPDKFPVTVIYENIDNGTVWTRPLSEFLEKFKPIKSQAEIEREDEIDEMVGLDPFTPSTTTAVINRRAFCELLYDAGYRKPVVVSDDDIKAILHDLVSPNALEHAPSYVLVATAFELGRRVRAKINGEDV